LARKYRQIQNDIRPIFDQLLIGEFVGDQVPGTEYTIYKVRAKNSDAQTGKSGGYRLIYQIVSPRNVIMHLIYAKSEQVNITADEIQVIVKEFLSNSEDGNL
jgi:mRNA-degrading endonuclease RelE of RelBE toxin-antitoxin system